VDLSCKYLIKLLETNGYYLKRTKGSHHLYFNPLTNKTVIVPIHDKELKKGTFLAILKQAGLDKKHI
jgi:predicted RNA binding protein YcfA (HicA-like mRNA interferase family)